MSRGAEGRKKKKFVFRLLLEPSQPAPRLSPVDVCSPCIGPPQIPGAGRRLVRSLAHGALAGRKPPAAPGPPQLHSALQVSTWIRDGALFLSLSPFLFLLRSRSPCNVHGADPFFLRLGFPFSFRTCADCAFLFPFAVEQLPARRTWISAPHTLHPTPPRPASTLTTPAPQLSRWVFGLFVQESHVFPSLKKSHHASVHRSRPAWCSCRPTRNATLRDRKVRRGRARASESNVLPSAHIVSSMRRSLPISGLPASPPMQTMYSPQAPMPHSAPLPFLMPPTSNNVSHGFSFDTAASHTVFFELTSLPSPHRHSLSSAQQIYMMTSPLQSPGAFSTSITSPVGMPSIVNPHVLPQTAAINDVSPALQVTSTSAFGVFSPSPLSVPATFSLCPPLYCPALSPKG